MTDEEKKRIALEALFQLDDELGAKVDHDRTIIVAALLEHAVGEPPSRRGGCGSAFDEKNRKSL
jgi:hypothetical protein